MASSAENVPRTMKAMKCHAPRDYRLEEVEVPEVGEGEVLVKVLAVGVCAGDTKCFAGASYYWGSDLNEAYVQAPVTPGHEFVGEVVKLGEGAGDKYNIELGDHAVAENIVPCWACQFCTRGNYNLCRCKDVFGYHQKTQGAMAEFMKYPKGALVHKVPQSIPAWQAAFIEPLACSVHAVELGDIQLPEVVVVSGCGPLGLGMVATARLKNPRTLVALDLLDWKLDIARSCGADVMLNPSKCDVTEEVKALTGGRGCDVYIEATGHPASVRQGLKLVSVKGKYVQFGVFGRESSVDWSLISQKEVKICGSFLSPYCYPTAISMLEKNLVPMEKIITHQLALSKAVEGITLVSKGTDSIKVVLLPNP